MQTKEKFNVSVILPLKSVGVLDFEDYFKKCIQSLKDQKYPINELVIVHTDETKTIEYLDSYDFGELNVVKLVWTKDPNFAEQINYGIQSAKSEWVSILEFDDEYSKIWFDNVRKYSEIFVDTDVFLPIVVDTDDKGMFAGFTNEATFALNISQEMGILSYETLQNFQNFQISGMAIKKSSYLNYGMIKPSFKLTFGYEFFLRMTYNSLKIMTIPKIGYKHTNMRTGSIFWNYKNGDERMAQEEVKFWIDSAKKESFFTSERDIKYII
jgi:glycosyltransferase involved in cell wall biosynthesis